MTPRPPAPAAACKVSVVSTPPTARTAMRGVCVLLLIGSTLPGCGGPSPRGPMATDVDPVRATPDYWWDRPSPVNFEVGDFDRAFAACQKVMLARFFEVDRADARLGVITSKPVTGAQLFEPWRRDTSTTGDVARSSIATYRRTVRFDIARTPAGRFRVTPRVLVERQTNVIRYQPSGAQTSLSVDQSALIARTQDGPAPLSYWYAVGRDYNLEATLADAVVSKMY
jgi:hypothetical protein